MAHSFFVRAQTGKIEFFLHFQTSQSTNVVAFCCFVDDGIELFESVIKLQIEAWLFVIFSSFDQSNLQFVAFSFLFAISGAEASNYWKSNPVRINPKHHQHQQ